MDAVIQGVENIADEENLRVRQDDRNHHYLKIWSFTATCNWLDIVEIRFTAVSESGNNNGVLLLIDSGE